MRAWIRVVTRRRRLIAATLAAVSMLCAFTALRPAPAPTRAVLVAARDLLPGVLKAGDLRQVAIPHAVVPDGALSSGAVGRTLATPMRRGEPLTDVRLLAQRLLSTLPPGTVAAPVRIADPDAARLLAPGDTIGVLAAWEGGQSAQAVADDVRVVTIPTGGDERGALVVLATTPDQAARLAAAQAGGRLSITINPHR